LGRLADVERNSTSPKREVEVLHATPEQFETVANLFQLYAYNFSDFHDVGIGEDGRFASEKLPLFWSEPNRYAFLVRFASKLAGFALVKKGSEVTNCQNVWDMTEFFVLRRYRRCGVGAEAARQIWRRLPGLWEIRVMECNSGAYHFWAHAIQTVLGRSIAPARVEIGEWRWYVFSFDQPCVAEKSD
jgi:predicted acetyltransferase